MQTTHTCLYQGRRQHGAGGEIASIQGQLKYV